MINPTRAWLSALLLCPAALACCNPPQDARGTAAGVNANALLACHEFEPIARDLDKGLLSDAEFRAGIQRVHDAAVLNPSDVSKRSEALLRVVTQGGTAQQWRQTFLDLVESCARATQSASQHGP